MVSVFIKQLPHAENLSLPSYATEDSAGVDLSAAIDNPIILEPFKRILVPTGICCLLPKGYEGQVRSRSGLSLKSGVIVLNAPGTIDADYQGEIKIILINLGDKPFTIERGTRVAQLIVAPYAKIKWEPTSHFNAVTLRGEKGFGSSGL